MNHTTQTILGVLVVIGFVMGALFLYERSEKDQAAQNVTASSKEYRNTDHGYSLSYPGDLEILEYTDDMASIGHLIEGGIASVAEVRVAIIQGNPGETFVDAARRNLATLCSADGPDSSFSCTGLKRGLPFVTDSGETGFEIYLEGELRTLATGSVESVEKGPFYVFLIEGDAGASKVLIVHAPLNQSTAEANIDAIHTIAKSVVFTPAEEGVSSINQYIADNISRLAPEPAQLGGTFYVTSIEATDGKGVVSYEDGHNAYTADFTYTIDPISITSFVLRPQ